VKINTEYIIGPVTPHRRSNPWQLT